MHKSLNSVSHMDSGAQIVPADWGRHFLPREIAKLCYEAGWIDAKRLAVAVAICIAESNGYEHRKHLNMDPNDPAKVLSIDRGIWAINDLAYPKVSDKIAYDAVAATRFARQIYVGRNNMFTAWAAFNNGSYKGPRALGYACPGVGNFLLAENGFPVK